MSDYISKSELVDSIMKNVLITTEEGFELRGEIVDLIKNQPTLDEKEIIRKAFERVVERLEECEQRYDDVAFAEMNENGHTLDFEYAKGKKNGVDEAIEIVKEECGINE